MKRTGCDASGLAVRMSNGCHAAPAVPIGPGRKLRRKASRDNNRVAPIMCNGTRWPKRYAIAALSGAETGVV